MHGLLLLGPKAFPTHSEIPGPHLPNYRPVSGGTLSGKGLILIGPSQGIRYTLPH